MTLPQVEEIGSGCGNRSVSDGPQVHFFQYAGPRLPPPAVQQRPQVCKISSRVRLHHPLDTSR